MTEHQVVSIRLTVTTATHTTSFRTLIIIQKVRAYRSARCLMEVIGVGAALTLAAGLFASPNESQGLRESANGSVN